MSEKLGNCPECRCMELRKLRGELVCMDCGLVVTKTSGRDLSLNDKPRKDANSSAHPSLVFQANHYVFDQKAWILEGLEKLLKVSDQGERNLAIALLEMTRIGINLSLPRAILEEASRIYKAVVDRRLAKGRSIKALAAAAVYVACRRHAFAVSLSDVANASGLEKKKIGRHSRILLRGLGCRAPSVDLGRYAERLLDRLKIKEEVRELVNKILEAIEGRKVSLKGSPVGSASAAVYMAAKLSNQRITQRQIAEASGITETTIRNRLRELENLIMPISCQAPIAKGALTHKSFALVGGLTTRA